MLHNLWYGFCVHVHIAKGKYAWGMNQCDWVFASARKSFEWLSSSEQISSAFFFCSSARFLSIFLFLLKIHYFDNAFRIKFGVFFFSFCYKANLMTHTEQKWIWNVLEFWQYRLWDGFRDEIHLYSSLSHVKCIRWMEVYSK